MEKKKPKISVVTVCYNSEKHIEGCIQSVVNQSYDNKEYVIIDGGSSDRTMDIVNKYRDRIDYVVSEPDKGISDAFNKGIKAATGDVMGICNADDRLTLDCLQIIADNYEEGVDIYRMNETVKDFKTGEEFLQRPTLVYPRVLYDHNTCHMGCWITKEAFDCFGMYDLNFEIQMDTELLRRFTVKGAKYKYIDANCGYFSRGGVSYGASARRELERKMIMERYGASKFEVWKAQSYHKFMQKIKAVMILLHINPTKMKAKLKGRQ